MAGDWLKIEKDTPEKPEILAVAGRLGVSAGDVFLGCFKLWRWADSQTVDGYAPRVTAASLDALCGLPGFACALREVGWLQAREGSLAIPNFLRHMGQPAKARALAAARMQRLRASPLPDERNISATESSPEKRREEKTKTEEPKTARFDPPTVQDVTTYCQSKGYLIDPEFFVAHYTANGWVQSNGQKIRNWQAAVVTWEKRRLAGQQPGRKQAGSRDDDLLDELRDASGS